MTGQITEEESKNIIDKLC